MAFLRSVSEPCRVLAKGGTSGTDTTANAAMSPPHDLAEAKVPHHLAKDTPMRCIQLGCTRSLFPASFPFRFGTDTYAHSISRSVSFVVGPKVEGDAGRGDGGAWVCQDCVRRNFQPGTIVNDRKFPAGNSVFLSH